jgi:ubiquinol-cytochrome c reductase subunit 6
LSAQEETADGETKEEEETEDGAEEASEESEDAEEEEEEEEDEEEDDEEEIVDPKETLEEGECAPVSLSALSAPGARHFLNDPMPYWNRTVTA